MLAGRQMTAATPVPFGPFLALSGWLIWLYGDAAQRVIDALGNVLP